jgi:hypothetical protein
MAAFPATPSGSQKIGPGQYVVWKKVEIAGTWHARQLVCANPVYGAERLKEWEAALRQQALKEAQAI